MKPVRSEDRSLRLTVQPTMNGLASERPRRPKAMDTARRNRSSEAWVHSPGAAAGPPGAAARQACVDDGVNSRACAPSSDTPVWTCCRTARQFFASADAALSRSTTRPHSTDDLQCASTTVARTRTARSLCAHHTRTVATVVMITRALVHSHIQTCGTF